MRLIKRVGILLTIVFVTGCAAPHQKAAEATAETKIVESTIHFNLLDYHEKKPPAFELLGSDGRDRTTNFKLATTPTGYAVAVNIGESILVEDFTYRWTLAYGRVISGTLRYQHPRYTDLTWQVAKLPGLAIYHADPVEQSELEEFQAIWQRLLTWTGQQPAYEPLVIIFYPEVATFHDVWGLPKGSLIRGYYQHSFHRVHVADASDKWQRKYLLSHELVHALTPHPAERDEKLGWFMEGSATLLEMRHLKLLGGADDRLLEHAIYRLQSLQLIAHQRFIDPFSPTPTSESANAYGIGAGVWLYVKRHHGDDGVRRLLASGAEPDGPQKTLEAMFGKPIGDIWADWNAYARSPQLIEDAMDP